MMEGGVLFLALCWRVMVCCPQPGESLQSSENQLQPISRTDLISVKQLSLNISQLLIKQRPPVVNLVYWSSDGSLSSSSAGLGLSALWCSNVVSDISAHLCPPPPFPFSLFSIHPT